MSNLGDNNNIIGEPFSFSYRLPKTIEDCHNIIREQNIALKHCLNKIDELTTQTIEPDEFRSDKIGFCNYTHLGYLTLNLDGIIIELNDRVAQVLGKTRHELTGARFDNFLVEYSFGIFQVFVKELFVSNAKKRTRIGLKRGCNEEYRIFIEGEVLSENICLINVVDISERNHEFDWVKCQDWYFHSLLMSMNVGIGIVDKNEVFLFTNPEAESIFGVEPGKLVGCSLIEFLPPSQLEIVKKETENRSNGKRTQYDLDINIKGGIIKTITVSGTPYYDRNGEYQGTLGSFIDITRQKNYEREIQRRLNLEYIVSEISSDFVHLKKGNQDFIVNNALRKIGNFVGVDRSYIFLFTEDRLYSNITYEWCREGIIQQIQNLLQIPVNDFPWWRDKLKKFETICVPIVDNLPDDALTERELLEKLNVKSILTIPLSMSGTIIGFLGFDSIVNPKDWQQEDMLLLTTVGEIIGNGFERLKHEEDLIRINSLLELKVKKRNADLIKLHELYRAIIDNVELMVISTDKNGLIKSINPFAERKLGYTADEVVEKYTPFYFHDHDEMSKYFSKEKMKAFDYLITFDQEELLYTKWNELTLVAKNGTKINALLTINKLKDDAGEVFGFVGVATDITSQKTAEREQIKITQNLTKLIQNLHSGILFEDENRRVYMVNQAFCDLAGIEFLPEALIGMECTELSESCKHLFADFESYMNKLDLIISKCETVSGEELYLNDGRVYGLDFIPILYEGDRLGYIWQIRDITSFKRNEKYAILQRDLGFNLAKTSTIDQALNEVIQTVSDIEGVDLVGIYLFNLHSETLELYSELGFSPNLIEKNRIYTKESILYKTVQKGRAVYKFYDERGETSDILLSGFKNLGIIPINHEGNVIGSLHVGTKWVEGLSYTSKLLLEAICAQIGGTLARIHMGMAFRLSQNNFHLMFDTIDDFVFILNTEGKIIKTNPVVEHRLGFTRDEIQKLSILDIFPQPQIKKAEFVISERLAGGVNPFLISVCKKNGEIIPVETKIVVGKWDGNDALYGISRDITERVEAEESLRKSEARWHFALEGSGDGVWDFNLKTNEVFYSLRWKTMLGYADNEIENKYNEWERRVHPEDLPACYTALQKYIKGETDIYTTEHRILCKDGKYKWILARGKVVERNDSGEPIRIIGTHTDITPRKQFEKELVKTIEKERELNELKSLFLSTASHEFRTPLASILMLCETLITYQDKMSASQISARLSKVRDHVLQLTNIVNDVLQLSSIQEGKVEFNPRQLDIVALCRNIVESFNSTIITKGQIKFSTKPNNLYCNIDHRLMFQSVSNLLSNAIKYTGDKPEISLELNVGKDEWTIIVTDNGIGIPLADQKHLFKPFFRASNVSTIQGNGLGLNIVYESVRMHGGNVSFTSEQSKGTIFTLHFPLGLILE